MNNKVSSTQISMLLTLICLSMYIGLSDVILLRKANNGVLIGVIIGAIIGLIPILMYLKINNTHTNLNIFEKNHPNRYYDVGIAEQHATTFAAGLAKNGMKPYFAVYSSFLQRAYDQIIHDVCITSKPVTFLIDRAGIVGEDGATHNGVFDLSYLTNIPNFTVIAPTTINELEKSLEYTLEHTIGGSNSSETIMTRKEFFRYF